MNTLTKLLLAASIIAGALSACQRDQEPIKAIEGKGDHDGFHGVARDLDILFVVDNSGSMAEEQQNLRDNFPALIASLRNEQLGPDGSGRPCNGTNQSGCKIPHVRIGVTSTDLGAGSYTSLPSCEVNGGDGGELRALPASCAGLTMSDAYIEYDDHTGKSNVQGSGDEIGKVIDAFACLADLGTSGCGFEQPLEAARKALDGTTNPGFVRSGAVLAVVFVTDEDDCSARNPQLYDPTQAALTDPLGPLTSFRCFEFGVTCDINDRSKLGPRSNCVPAAGTSGFFHDIDQRYVAFLKGLKPAGDVVVAAIAGPSARVEVSRDGNNPTLGASCQSGQGIATPAIRLTHVVDAFGADGHLASICSPNFGMPLATLGQTLRHK